MSTSKHIDKICCLILTATLALTLFFMNAGRFGIQAVSASVGTAGYSARIFDPSRVHTIDIVMDDWDTFLENCTDEEYTDCTVIIDGEPYRNVAIRAKGNTSLTSVKAYGNDRYSFKIEFDHYDDALSYYGLDKLCLNNIIQDNTYMKDYLTYRLMYEFGADTPLCSYAYITVNGEDWGLYLAVEGVEESFLKRNYGNDHGQLYKPDSMKMGGGRGNGREFNMEDFDPAGAQNAGPAPDLPENPAIKPEGIRNEASPPMHGENNNALPENQTENTPAPEDGKPDFHTMPDNNNAPGFGAPSGKGMLSSDVSLLYTDDAFESYSNIFDNAKTSLSDADKRRLIESIRKLNSAEDIENTVSTDEVIRYFVVHNFVLNFDSYTGSMIHNYYLYEKDGQLSMIPWDYNLAFGAFESGSDATGLVNYPIDTPVSGGTVDSRPMLAWIFGSDGYTELYHQYFGEFLSEYFDNGYFESMIDSVSDMIAPYVEKDPTKFCSYEEFEKGVSTLRTFCLLRAESIHGQLNGMIPSTSDGQAKDASSLIDAGALVISDMGDMGNMGGPGRMHGFPPGFENSAGDDAPSDFKHSPEADLSPDFKNPPETDVPSGDDTPKLTPSVSDKTGRKAPPS